MDVEDTGETREESTMERAINYTGLLPVFLLLVVVIARISYELYKSKRQKTRSPQQRRMYAGTRARPSSFSQPEPTIYVSPANLPPPPKYECMAPPSYEEVIGVHYPQFQPQPITQPITTAMAHESPGNSRTNATSSTNPNCDTTVVTVTADDRRTAVTVATSS